MLVNLDPTIGTEMSKTRPGVIISNNYANKSSNRVSVAPITSTNLDKIYPFEILIMKNSSGLNTNSKVTCDQIRSLDKIRLIKKIGSLDAKTMDKVKAAIRLHFDL